MQYHKRERKDKGEWEKKYLPYSAGTFKTIRWQKRSSNRKSKLKWKWWNWWNERPDDFRDLKIIISMCRSARKPISKRRLNQLKEFTYFISPLYGELWLVNSFKRFYILNHVISQLVQSIIGETVTINDRITGKLISHTDKSAKILTKESLVCVNYVWGIKRNLRQIE